MTIPADVKAYNKQLIAEFRANGGPPGGRQILLLTTIGARTGRSYTTPMMFIPHGEDRLVIASNAGAPRHPDWFHNLVSHPDVTVEVAGDTYQANARVPEGAERDRIWASVVQQYPFFADHQAKVSRTIPVVVLERRPPE
jgi:deazaflavin-dependent oxidoreductase (nitroreductase family)